MAKLILNKMKRGEVVSDKSRMKKIKQQDLHSLTGVFRIEGIALKA